MPQMDETALEAHEETRKGSIVCLTTKPQLFQTEIGKEINWKKKQWKGKNEMNFNVPLSQLFFSSSLSKERDLKAHMKCPSVFKVAFVYSHFIYIQLDKSPSSFNLLNCVACRLGTVCYALDLVIA